VVADDAALRAAGRIRPGEARESLARAVTLAVGGRGAARPAAEAAAQRLPATLAQLVELDEGTLLTMRVSSLDWMARGLAGLDRDFAIRRPDELRGSVRALADRLAASS
jgi:predicted DNA-binding transcriptional regulator YafY